MTIAWILVAPVLLASGLSAQALSVSLEAELTVQPVRGKPADIEVRFRCGAPYKIARAVTKVNVAPAAKRLKGSEEWRGALQPNQKRTQIFKYRLPKPGEYLVTASFKSLHSKTGEVVTGTQRTQRVRLSATGIELIAEGNGG
jgi:hypothetical protein